MKVLITGSAGFIGFSLALRLLKRGDIVIGIDNHNDYYDPKLKIDRLAIISKYDNYHHNKIDISNRNALAKCFKKFKPERVINLAAQAGVQYSIKNPYTYIDCNIVGFINVLEECRNYKIEHLVYASSSSVYGANTKMPFSIHHNVDHPISLYAATKKSNELMAHTYSYLYNLPTTGLRFFTVYGPWGRPDMALFKFTKSIIENKPIDVYNYGNHKRDFTYIDDIVEGLVRVLDKIPIPNPNWDSDSPDPGSSLCPWRVYNIGSNKPIEILDYISEIENALEIKAKKRLLPLQIGDVPDTYADVTDLVKFFNYQPKSNINFGISNFVNWYLKYYKINDK